MTDDVQVPDGGGDVEAMASTWEQIAERFMAADGVGRHGYAAGSATAYRIAASQLRAALASQPVVHHRAARAMTTACGLDLADDWSDGFTADLTNVTCRDCLASQPAPTVTDEAVEAAALVLAPILDGHRDVRAYPEHIRDAHRNGDWPSFTHRGEAIDRMFIADAITAALPHLTPAQSGDGVAEAAWDEGHRRGYDDGYDDNGNGYAHDPDVEYTPEGNPYRIARTTTEEGE